MCRDTDTRLTSCRRCNQDEDDPGDAGVVVVVIVVVVVVVVLVAAASVVSVVVTDGCAFVSLARLSCSLRDSSASAMIVSNSRRLEDSVNACCAINAAGSPMPEFPLGSKPRPAF